MGIFWDKSVKSKNKSDFTNTLPVLLKILGEEYSVKNWRDVLETTLNVLAELDPNQFNDIIEQFPRFLGKDQTNFKKTRTLKNGIFIEVNLSANDIYDFCQKAIEITELPKEEWEIETIK